MIVNIGYFEKDTFVSSICIKVDGDLILRSQDLLWCGKEKKLEIINQVKKFVSDLKEMGAEVFNEDVLDNLP